MRERTATVTVALTVTTGLDDDQLDFWLAKAVSGGIENGLPVEIDVTAQDITVHIPREAEI